MSLSPSTFEELYNIFLLRLTPYVGEITGDRQCGFRWNESTSGQIFCTHQIIEKKKWEFNSRVHQLYVDFKRAYVTGKRNYTIFSPYLVYKWN